MSRPIRSVAAIKDPLYADLYGKASNIWLATAASYADRLAAFALPLFVLKGMGREDAYIAIEYVISLSIVLATFFDAGLRNYVLFHARLSGSAQDTMHHTLQAYAPMFLLYVLVVASLGMVCWLSVNVTNEFNLVVLSITRACALSIIGLSTQLLILHRRPALAPLLSMLHWLVSGIAFLLPANANVLSFVRVFFFANVCMMAAAAFVIFIRWHVRQSAQGLKHLRAALSWGWPLLLAAAASMLVANFSKVYAYSSLPQQDAVGFMFWFRIFSVVQLGHVALMAVLVLEIYSSSMSGLLRNNLQRYVTYLLPTAVMVLVAASVSSAIGLDLPRISWPTFMAIGAYILMWCFGAYLEVYLSRDGKNMQVLIASVAASSAYVMGLLISPPHSATHLALLMCLSATIYLVFLWRIFFSCGKR